MYEKTKTSTYQKATYKEPDPKVTEDTRHEVGQEFETGKTRLTI